MVVEKPRLVYQTKVERRTYIRRFFWALLAIVGAIGAWAALFYVQERGIMTSTMIPVGQVLALGVAALFAVRGFFNLLRGIRSKNETVRFYDRGFRWTRGKDDYKYSWSQISTFRQGMRQVKIGNMILFQSGAHTFRMRDGNVLRFTPAHGDSKRFLLKVRPFISDIMGEKIGRALRNGMTVRVHPSLALSAEGIEVGKNRISWEDADVKLENRRLIISRKTKDGTFKPVKKLSTSEIDNLGGVVEIAHSTIKNHQPERFNIKVQKPTFA